jgi:hypothetical protein
MKFSLSEISQAIAEELQEVYEGGDDFFSDREANPHDDSMYGDPEGGYPEDQTGTLQTAANMLMEVHSLLEEGLDSGEYEMYEEQKLDQVSEMAYDMYQQIMHMVEGSMAE